VRLVIVQLPDRIADRLRDSARARGVTYKELILDAVEASIDHLGDLIQRRPHRNGGLVQQQRIEQAQLALGATIGQALSRLVRQSIRRALLPMINTMSAAGVVTLPGIMTGQILAGLDPVQAITVETRTYSRRRPSGEEIYQVSLERRRLKIRWGRDDQARRLQTLAFDSAEDARGAFLARAAELESQGFLAL